MCELFAMSSRVASDVNYSLHEFARHGGEIYNNKSGWGIAYYADRDAIVIREPEPASDSPWVDFVASQGLKSKCVVAHIRMATMGAPTLENTHPFRRSLGGRLHVFAHNGILRGIHEGYPPGTLERVPIGETDSELAFCLLLERLAPLWHRADSVPALADRLNVFAEFASEMLALGSANFLYADSDALFVHAHRRRYEENGRFGEPQPPGLSMRECARCETGQEYACDGLKVGMPDPRVVLFASVPLGDQGWVPLPEGTAVAARDGEVVGRVATL